MKQDAFFQRLRQELANLPKHEVDEIVADYREYIGDAIAAGRNEEEVVAALGDPAKLARELKAQATYRQWQERRSFSNLARVVVSIAGLGLLNVILLVPFMLYLLLLTAGYTVSSAFAIGGLVAVVAIGSHNLFGWPRFDGPHAHISVQSNHAASDASGSNDDDASDASDTDEVKVEGDHFVLNLDDGSKASIVTRAGLVEMKNEDDKLKIVAVGEAADKLLTPVDDDTYQIRTDDVTSLQLKDDDGTSVSIVHSTSGKPALVWDVHDKNGADHMQFEQDAQGNTKHFAAQSGKDSVVIDPSKGISISDDHSNVHIVAPMGSSPLSGMAFSYALAMLIGGVLGLIVCIWLTRATWRALSRYLHRQIDAISGRLDEHGQTT